MMSVLTFITIPRGDPVTRPTLSGPSRRILRLRRIKLAAISRAGATTRVMALWSQLAREKTRQDYHNCLLEVWVLTRLHSSRQAQGDRRKMHWEISTKSENRLPARLEEPSGS